MAEWKFGTVLERRGEKVLFLSKEAGRNWTDKFQGLRLTQGRDTPRGNKPGGVGLYTMQGWKVIDDLNMTVRFTSRLPTYTEQEDIKRALAKMTIAELTAFVMERFGTDAKVVSGDS